MTSGTPTTLKCPHCRLGKWGHPRPRNGVRATGFTETRVTKSKHQGHGNGGASFIGYRGQVICLDCGHKWYSTHPDSGRSTTQKAK